MVLSLRRLALAVAALTAWVAAPARGAPIQPDLGDIALRDGDAASVLLRDLLARHRFTTVVFYSESCPCFAAHLDRLQRIAAELGPRGAAVLLVDSERHAPGDVPPRSLGSGLPIWTDPGARLARRLDVHLATESLVFDRAGRLQYRGGIDDQRKHITGGARPYLQDALNALLDGRQPPTAASKALGCTLRLY